MKQPHKHAELIKAWADGAEIEFFDRYCSEWRDSPGPSWGEDNIYRIKLEPKTDVVYETNVKYDFLGHRVNTTWGGFSNLKLTFDGETGTLKSAEVL